MWDLVKQRKKWLLTSVSFLFAVWFTPWVLLYSCDSIPIKRNLPGQGEVTVNAGPGTQDWVPFEKLPKHVYGAFVAAEDTKFFDHWGLDLAAIQNSISYNLKKGRFARGGSTISQQLIKISLLSHHKSLIRKGREAVGTVLAELLYSKETLLEWYLNLIEVGPGLYGIKQGAKTYFRKAPQFLTVAEAIHLSLVLPNPKTWSQSLRRRSLSDFAMKRFAAIATNMKLGGFINLTEWQQVMDTGNFGAPIRDWPKAFDQAISKLSGVASELNSAKAEAEAEVEQSYQWPQGMKPNKGSAAPKALPSTKPEAEASELPTDIIRATPPTNEDGEELEVIGPEDEAPVFELEEDF